MMKFEGMKMPQLLTLILSDGEESQTALWYVITDRQKDKLLACFNSSTDPEKTYDAGKIFEDYLADFYLYLYEGHPIKENQPPHFYYLSKIKEKSKFASWLTSTFRTFLFDQRRTLLLLQQALPGYEHTRYVDRLPEEKIPVFRIAFSLAQFNQRKPADTRYFFFRKLRQEVVKDFDRMEELTDEETAEAMGIERTTIFRRVRDARKEVRESIESMSQKDLSQLNPLSLALVNRISDMEPGDLNDIVMDLMDDAEKELTSYQSLVDARSKKVQKIFLAEDGITFEQEKKQEMEVLEDFVSRFTEFVAKKR